MHSVEGTSGIDQAGHHNLGVGDSPLGHYLIDIVFDGVIVFMNGRVKWVNNAGIDLLGMDPLHLSILQIAPDIATLQDHGYGKCLMWRQEYDPSTRIPRRGQFIAEARWVCGLSQHDGTLVFRDITRQQQLELRAKDVLKDNSGLLSERGLLEIGTQQLSRREQQGRFNVVMVMFVATENDQLTDGNAEGESSPVVADRLSKAVRGGDFACNLGNNFYAVLLSDIAGMSNIMVAARRIVDSVSPPYYLHGSITHVTVSAGIAIHNVDGSTLSQLVEAAHNVAASKNVGIRYADYRMQASADEETQRTAWVREALARNMVKVAQWEFMGTYGNAVLMRPHYLDIPEDVIWREAKKTKLAESLIQKIADQACLCMAGMAIVSCPQDMIKTLSDYVVITALRNGTDINKIASIGRGVGSKLRSASFLGNKSLATMKEDGVSVLLSNVPTQGDSLRLRELEVAQKYFDVFIATGSSSTPSDQTEQVAT